ncbi:MAG: CarD family transcriptional regulator [Acidimicrobiia bacterium]|nr:CarD family transcriptional regulator [Acidimicrobiia bacterium]
MVHPHHGAAEIIKRSKLDLAGEPRQYFELEIATESSLKVLIPVDTIDETIRPVITKTAAGKVLLKFKEDPQDSGANWSRWYKVLNEKMTSGDIFQVAEVVRDLTHAQQAKGISPALKRMLSKARTTLSSELAFALRVTPDQALERIDLALPTPETPEE